MSHLLDLSESGPKYAIVDPVPDEFPSGAFTLSMYVCTEDQRDSALFSYGVEGDDDDANELLLFRPSNLGVYIAGESHSTGVNIADGQLHAVVLTRSVFPNPNETKLYVDGRLLDTWDAPTRGLRGGGCLTIGQDQDRRGGGFSERNAFRGTVGHITLWADVHPPTVERPLCDGLLNPGDTPVLHIAPAAAALRGVNWAPSRRLDARRVFGMTGLTRPPADRWIVGEVIEGDALDRVWPNGLEGSLSLWVRPEFDSEPQLATAVECVICEFQGLGARLVACKSFFQTSLRFDGLSSSAVFACSALGDGRPHAIGLIMREHADRLRFDLWVDGEKLVGSNDNVRIADRLDRLRLGAASQSGADGSGVRVSDVLLTDISRTREPLFHPPEGSEWALLTPPSDSPLALPLVRRFIVGREGPVDGSAFGDLNAPAPVTGQRQSFSLTFWLALRTRCADDVVEYCTPNGTLVVHSSADGLIVRLDDQERLRADAPELDRWISVAIVGRVDGIRLFINGVIAASFNTPWPLPLGGRLRFGGRETVSIRELALWRDALAADALAALGQVPLRADDGRLLYLASAATADAQGTPWSDEGWLTFESPPEAHAIVRPVPVDFPDQALSVTFWIQTSERGHWGTIVSYFADGHDDLIVMRPHALRVSIGGRVASTDVDVADGRWHFVAVTWQRTGTMLNGPLWQMRVYVDGDERWSKSNIGPTRELNAGGSLVVGQEQDKAGGSFVEDQALRGEVSHVALWSRALPGEQVQAEMDRVPAGDDLYLLVSPVTADVEQTTWPASTALTLSDATQRAVLACVDAMPTHRWSVTLWVRTAQRGVYNGVFSYAVETPGSTNELLIWRLHALEVWVAGKRHKTGIDVADDRWHFLAVTFADGRLSVFVDGMRKWQSEIGPRVLGAGGILLLGQDQDRENGEIVPDEKQAFFGQLDDVSVWDHALSRATIGDLLERPLDNDEAGRVLTVSSETATLEGTVWRDDRVHPALMRLAALSRLRRWLDGAGFRLRPETFTTALGITAELTLDPDYTHFETLKLSQGRTFGRVEVEVENVFDPHSAITLKLSPRFGVPDTLAVTHPSMLAEDADGYRSQPPNHRLIDEWGWRTPNFAGMFRGRVKVLTVTIDRSSAIQRYSIAGEAPLFGVIPGTYAVSSSGAITADGQWNVGEDEGRLSLHVRRASGAATIESCSLFNGKVSFSGLRCDQTGATLFSDVLVLDTMQGDSRVSLEAPFTFHGKMRVEIGRVWDSVASALSDHVLFYWSLPGDEYHTRIFARWYAVKAAPTHVEVQCHGTSEGEPLVATQWVKFSTFADSDLAELLDGIWETKVALVEFQEDIEAVQGELQALGSVDLVDLIEMLADSTPDGLGAARGLLKVTHIAADPSVGERRVVVSGQVEVLRVPGGDIELELRLDGEEWVFAEVRATSGLSYDDTDGVIDVELTARIWLEVTGVQKSVEVNVGVFDGLLDVELPNVDLSLPLQVPDLLEFNDLGLPAVLAELKGSLELRFTEQSLAVTWDPTVTADFWIADVSATAMIHGEVDLAESGSVSLEAGFRGSVLGIELDDLPAVEVSVSDLKSVAGLSRVFLNAAKEFISELNPADFAIRFAMRVGEALWDAAGAAIGAVGDVLGLSGEEEGSKVGFMEFVRTAVMWEGRYYFFHGAKDTVWRINDRDVDGGWPKSASGSWTHMPVIGESNRLRNILKVQALVDGEEQLLLVFDLARGAIGRSYVIGEPFSDALAVRWDGSRALPDDIHTSIFWVGKGTFVFHGKGMVSKVNASVSGSTLTLTTSGTEKVSKANGWWDADEFTVVPTCAVEGDRDGGADDTDKLYFFDFRNDCYIRCSHPASSSASSVLTIDADFRKTGDEWPKKITTGWL